jgi:beta-phosphoglucomutase
MIQNIIEVPLAGIRGILFDLDGVIIDSEPLHFKAWRFALTLHRTPELTWEEFLKYIYGKADTQVLDQLVETKKPDVIEKIILGKNKFFCDHLSEIPVMPEIISFLKQQSDFHVALVSNALGIEVDELLTFNNIKSKFHAIVTADLVKHPKPNPEPYEKAYQSLQQREAFTKDQCLVIEDSDIGSKAAIDAGFKYVLKRDFGHQDVKKLIQMCSMRSTK